MGMENFEQFRKKTAETVKSVPKSARKEVLEAIKKEDPKKYQEAKNLKEAKRGAVVLSKTESLANPENVKEVIAWMKSEFDDYTEKHDGYLSYSHLEDLFKEIASYLAKRLQIKIGNSNMEGIVRHNYGSIKEDEYGDADRGIETGSMDLMDEEVFEYHVFTSGEGLEIDKWNDGNLEAVIPKLIEYLRSQNK